MLAAVVDEANRGHAFGFHRAMDNFGGVMGPLLAFLLLRLAELPLRTVFMLSVVPGLVSVLIAQVFLKDLTLQKGAPKQGAPHDDTHKNDTHDAATGGGAARPAAGAATHEADGRGAPALAPARLRDAPPWRFFIVTAVFTLAASGDLFLMRRLTISHVAYVPVAWVSLQLLKGLFNVPGGRASIGTAAVASSQSRGCSTRRPTSASASSRPGGRRGS